MKVLLVGLGRWGKNHFKALKRMDVEIYVSDLEVNRLDCDTPLDHKSTNYQDFIQKVDAVIVATPTDSHLKICRDAFKGKKDVFVEKPIAMTTVEAREMRLHQDGQILQVGHIYRYNQIVIETKKILDEGQLGNIRYASARFTDYKTPRTDVGVTHTDAIHYFDMFNYFFGEIPLSVTAVTENYIPNSFDNVSIAILHYRDKIVHIESSCMTDKQRDFVIVGENGVIHRNLLLPEYSPSPLEVELQAFIDSVKDRSKPLADWKAGYDALRVVEACYESSKEGRRMEIK